MTTPLMIADSPAVVAETVAGDVLSLAQAAKLCPPNPNRGPVAPQTLSRWIHHGVTGPNGTRVHLEACRWGCRWMTSRAALRRFLAALSGATAQPSTQTAESRKPATVARPSKRKEQVNAAVAELEKRGC